MNIQSILTYLIIIGFVAYGIMKLYPIINKNLKGGKNNGKRRETKKRI